MPYLQQGQSATVIIPATQSIRLGALRGALGQILIPMGLPGGPIATVSDSQSVFGAYPAGATVQVSATIGECEYVVGAAPVLTDQTYNPAAVAITGGTASLSTITGTPTITSPQINGGSVSLNQGTLRLAPSAGLGGLQIAITDSSGTPGNATQNSAIHGRAAFAAAATSVVVTNNMVTANASVFVALGSADTTLTSVRVTPAAGSFTVTGNAAATAATTFSYFVVQN